ncbi:hypothetical protein H5368_06145 [Luteimonas sp. MC1782]|uniref:hypothetical protein n=1 Tax=Luteimonas sp. MC1782 TaxID=2760305 RepID=UPI001602FD2F|nr:hypothetical protein [Luteimonas sp. MC1782]MBB1472604.1 hypothetical protein [Luteimonas sp. MC1782]
MDDHTKENSIAVLKRLRDVYQSQLDTRVIVELEAVIAALEKGCDCSVSESPVDWGVRALKIVAEVIRVVTNITDLMS